MDTTLVPHRITLRSGQRVLVRALRPDDGPGLVEAFEQLSEISRYRRFFVVKPHLSEQSVAYFTNVDHHDHEALVAVAPDSGQLVGVARFIRDPEKPDQAEVAVTVIDSWQRHGLGAVLLSKLAQRAAEEGVRRFTAEILAENQPMLTLAHRLGRAETTLDGPTVSTRIELQAAPQRAATFDGYDLLRAAARGEFIGVPAVLRGWLDLTEKIIATLLVPVSAFRNSWRPDGPAAIAPASHAGRGGERRVSGGTQHGALT
ncbi:MAG: GNAT family N-acetyltransferase [Streptosporangiaceae bacterium]|jgi:RimJ/RimL family protein N-acetyltransferase